MRTAGGHCAAGCTTLVGAIEDLPRRGFTERFRLADGGLRPLGTEKIRAEDLVIPECPRFEGVSDADGMAIVYAIQSTAGVRGTLAAAFGVFSDPATSAVLKGIPILTRAE